MSPDRYRSTLANYRKLNAINWLPKRNHLDNWVENRRLQDAVRQKRARLVREKEKRSVKRLDLRDTVCAKLESLSRASRLHQRTLVENLITDEAAIRNSESVTLKRERQKIKEDSKRVKEKEAELKARDAELKAKEVELSRREDGMSQGLDRLAAFEKLLNTVIECEVDDLNVQINVDQGDAIKSLIVFSSASSPDSVNPLADAWNEVLDHFGEGARHS